MTPENATHEAHASSTGHTPETGHFTACTLAVTSRPRPTASTPPHHDPPQRAAVGSALAAADSPTHGSNTAMWGQQTGPTLTLNEPSRESGLTLTTRVMSPNAPTTSGTATTPRMRTDASEASLHSEVGSSVRQAQNTHGGVRAGVQALVALGSTGRPVARPSPVRLCRPLGQSESSRARPSRVLLLRRVGPGQAGSFS